MWNLPDLPTGRIGRLVVLNTALPPHPLFRELGLQNALLVAIWMAAVSIAGRYIPVGEDDITKQYVLHSGTLGPCSVGATNLSNTST